MSGFQLGRIGIVVLALYVLLEAISAGVRVVDSATVADAESMAVAVASFLGAVLVFGVLPSAILIANRNRLAQRWFGAEGDAELPVDARELLQVGLVLVALVGILEGVVGLAGAGMMSVSIQSASASVREGTTAQTLEATLSSLAVRAIVNLLLGTLLLWFARPLSRRLS